MADFGFARQRLDVFLCFLIEIGDREFGAKGGPGVISQTDPPKF